MGEAPQISISEERTAVISGHSQEVRAAAAHNIVAAAMYHQVETGDPETFRTAAQWIIQNGKVGMRSIKLDDDEYLKNKKISHLEAANEKVAEATRIESWAAALYDTKDAQSIIALKAVGTIEGLALDRIDESPQLMLKFEDETAAKAARAKVLKEERDDVYHKLTAGEELSTVNIALAVRQMKPRTTETVTIKNVVSVQEQILSEMVEEADGEVQRRNDLMEALLTGELSENLRQVVLKHDPSALIAKREETPYDEMYIEELELGIRSYNCIKRAGLQTVGDLLDKDRAWLEDIPNLGNKSIDEIIETLRHRGLSLRESAS